VFEGEITGLGGAKRRGRGRVKLLQLKSDSRAEHILPPFYSACKPLVTMNFKWILAIIVMIMLLLSVPGIQGYDLDYYDCRTPSSIEKYARPSICDPTTTNEETTLGMTYEVLTESATRELQGHSCEIVTSEWRYRCGIFSHLKLASVPHLLRHASVSVPECRRMVRRESYTPPGRVTGMPLKLNTWNYFSMTASGDLAAYPDHMECTGQETRHGDELVENEVVLIEIRIRIRNEEYLANHGLVESSTDHLAIPCNVPEEGCQTSEKTYIWKDPGNECNLKRIRTIAPNKTQDTWLVDHHHQLLFNDTGVYPSPSCKMVLKTTQLDNVHLADLTRAETREQVYPLDQIHSRDINVQLNTAMALEYTAYQLSRQIEARTWIHASIIEKQLMMMVHQPSILSLIGSNRPYPFQVTLVPRILPDVSFLRRLTPFLWNITWNG
jgi:hypothetical protein